jgi:predicted Zn-dependent protease
LRSEPYPLGEFALGVALWENGKPIEAEPVLRKGLEHDGSYAKGYYYLSLALFDQNRTDEAEENASKAQHLQPELPAVYLILANIHARRRMVREQLRDLEMYLKLESPGPRRETARRRCEALQGKLAQEKAQR